MAVHKGVLALDVTEKTAAVDVGGFHLKVYVGNKTARRRTRSIECKRRRLSVKVKVFILGGVDRTAKSQIGYSTVELLEERVGNARDRLAVTVKRALEFSRHHRKIATNVNVSHQLDHCIGGNVSVFNIPEDPRKLLCVFYVVNAVNRLNNESSGKHFGFHTAAVCTHSVARAVSVFSRRLIHDPFAKACVIAVEGAEYGLTVRADLTKFNILHGFAVVCALPYRNGIAVVDRFSTCKVGDKLRAFKRCQLVHKVCFIRERHNALNIRTASGRTFRIEVGIGL